MVSKTGRKKLVEGRIDTSYHRYRIVGGEQGGECHAIAYLGRRKVYATTGETVAAAVASLERMLDEHIERLARERADGVPSAVEYREALLALDAVVPEETMGIMAEHSRLPGGVATIGDLARRSDRDEKTMMTDYARVGRKLGALLAFTPRQEGLGRAITPILTFAVVETSSNEVSTTLRLRPQVLATFGEANRETSRAWP